MKLPCYIALLMVVNAPAAESTNKTVIGKITYLASGAVYTSLGRTSGVSDSSIIYVVSGIDTVGVLRVFALSSTSCVCSVVKADRPFAIGNDVVSVVSVEEPRPPSRDSATVSVVGRVEGPSEEMERRRSSLAIEDAGMVEVRGRISAQYYRTSYSTAALSTSQPGLVLNLQARAVGIPARFEMYSNLRMLSYGNEGVLSGKTINQSRIYRLALTFDDSVNTVSLGRMVVNPIPSIGYIDGLMASRRFSSFEIGSMFGYQPGLALRSTATDFKKFGAFIRYASGGPLNLSISSAYARIYSRKDLDRELVSTQVNAFTIYNLHVYASSEVDLRRKSGSNLESAASLTNLFASVSYRFSRAITMGVGGNASRPVLPFSSIRDVPDSLLDRRLKSGMNANVSFLLPGGVTISNSYSPRSSEGSFGREYSNFSSLGVADIFSSGVSFRSNLTVNSNLFTRSLGYGGSLQRNVAGIADLTFRYQKYGYTVLKTDRREHSETVGIDLLVTISRQLGIMMSYDRLSGFGSVSHSLFSELSMRF